MKDRSGADANAVALSPGELQAAVEDLFLTPGVETRFRVVDMESLGTTGGVTKGNTLITIQDENGLTGRVVQKEIHNRRANWKNEAGFYSTVAPDVPRDLVVPTLFGLVEADDDSVILTMSYLENFRFATTLDDKERIAHAFGSFGGRFCRSPRREPWMRRTAGVRRPAEELGIEGLLESLDLSVELRARLRRSFQSFFEDELELRSLFRSLPETLVHGDANDRNVLIDSDGRCAAVDWAGIAVGSLGEDVVRIALPWIAVYSGLSSPADLAIAEESLLRSYADGARAVGCAVDAAELSLAYSIRAATLTASIAPQIKRLLDLSSEASRPRRKLTVAAHLENVANRIETTQQMVRQMTAPRSEMNQEVLTAKYVGSGATSYESSRAGEQRWWDEHGAVSRHLHALTPDTVLDLPVGTGRFIPIYKELDVDVLGIDISADMIEQATQAAATQGFSKLRTRVGDSTKLDDLGQHDVSVCVRFLNWLAPSEAEASIKQIARLTRHSIVLSLVSTRDSDFEPDSLARIHASLRRSREKALEEGRPATVAHSWNESSRWFSEAGFRVVDTTEILENERTKNQILRLDRVHP